MVRPLRARPLTAALLIKFRKKVSDGIQNMEKVIIGQALGIAATLITFASYQFNTKRVLLIIQTAATLCTCLSFLFLGASTGFALNIVCLVRNVVFYFENGRAKLQCASAILLACVMAVLGALSWQGWISLLMIVALAVNTVFMSLRNLQLFRKSILLTSSMILLYDVIIFSIGGIFNEALSIVSSAVGLVRYRKRDLTNQNSEEEAEA
jgi:hypothetical protein